MALLRLSDEQRAPYFEDALAEALIRISAEAAYAEIEPRELTDEVRARSDQAWASCASEESEVAQLLAARENETQSSVASKVVGTSQATPKVSDESLEVAERRLRDALVEKGVLPAFRELINLHTADSYDLLLTIEESPGLSELFDPAYEISTAATDALGALLQQMPGGSIGISGPRGAGKTTLLRSFCQGRGITDSSTPLVAVMVAAPVDYEGREFVLHLFASICRSVLAIEAFWTGEIRDRRWILRSLLARLLGVFVFAAGVALILSAAFGWHLHLGWPWIAGAALLVAGVGLSVWSWPRLIAIRTGLGDQAYELLRQIKFQQSFTTGWSGSLKLPAGAELGIDQSQTLAERQLSFPDIVDRFRAFVTAVAGQYRVIIGIDEMDKIESEEKAQAFLNDIKGVFGIERCFYLVSISEDALSNFERRGLPFRDAFDSSFDDVVVVRFLDFADAQRLLHRRVVGLSVPFLALAYCVSGGLPRDLVRVAREIVLCRELPELERNVDSVCRSLVASELKRKTEAISIAARLLGVEPEFSDFIRWVKALRATKVTAPALLDQCRAYPATLHAQIDEEAGQAATERAKLRRLGSELVGFTYYASTLLDFFDRSIDRARLEKGERSAVDACRLDALAEARQTFGINSAIAWEQVSAFRAAWEREQLVFPHSLLTSSPPLARQTAPA